MREIYTEVEVGDLDRQAAAQRFVACHTYRYRTDPIHPVRCSFQPVIPRAAEDIGQQQRVATAMTSGTLFDLDVLGRFPVALQGEPLSAGTR